MKRCAVALLALMSAALAVPFAQAQNNSSPTLDAIQDRGRVVCGVSANQPGFSKANNSVFNQRCPLEDKAIRRALA